MCTFVYFHKIILVNNELVKYLKKSCDLISDQHFSFKGFFKISLKDHVVLSTTGINKSGLFLINLPLRLPDNKSARSRKVN